MTGRQPLLPRWAMGNIASRMGYHSQAEVEAVVDGFLRDGIPLDAIVLDLFWFGPSIFGSMGNLDWDRKAFPEPVEMMDKIRRPGRQDHPDHRTAHPQGVEQLGKRRLKQVLATDAEGNPQTFTAFFGEAGLVDVFNPPPATGSGISTSSTPIPAWPAGGATSANPRRIPTTSATPTAGARNCTTRSATNGPGWCSKASKRISRIDARST